MIESNVSLHFFNDGFFSWIELASGMVPDWKKKSIASCAMESDVVTPETAAA